MITAKALIEIMQGVFRTQFDIMAFDYDKNFHVEIIDRWSGDFFENAQYPKIQITVWPNGKPPEKKNKVSLVGKRGGYLPESASRAAGPSLKS